MIIKVKILDSNHQVDKTIPYLHLSAYSVISSLNFTFSNIFINLANFYSESNHQITAYHGASL